MKTPGVKPSRSWVIAKEITAKAVNFEIKGEPHQFTTQIDPIISNAMYYRELELLEYERQITIIRLSKLDFTEEALVEIIKGLGYKITK